MAIGHIVSKLLEKSFVPYLDWLQNQIRKTPKGQTTFFETDIYPWIDDLEKNWKAIRAELDHVMLHFDSIPNFQDIISGSTDLSQGADWKSFFFYGYGVAYQKGLKACPQTAKILKRIPGMQSAMFSILKPGKHIPPHSGPFNGVLRVQLGLIIPEEGRIEIRVGDSIRSWQEGKCMVFDDSFDHEVWNESDKKRVVLFLDITRPLPFPLSFLNWIAIQAIRRLPFFQEGFAKLENYPTIPPADLNTKAS